MRKLYLLLSIIGFIAPTVLVVQESIATGNILLYTQPLYTFEQMFANRISTIFMIDLLLAVCVFFIWTYQEHKKHKIKGLYYLWLLTMLFGLAGGFPLFLYLKDRSLEQVASS